VLCLYRPIPQTPQEKQKEKEEKEEAGIVFERKTFGSWLERSTPDS
jgi:hypothetical protein